MTRREYLFARNQWDIVPANPISLDRLVQVNLIPGVFVPLFDWLADAEQALADERDEAATIEDVRYGGCP